MAEGWKNRVTLRETIFGDWTVLVDGIYVTCVDTTAAAMNAAKQWIDEFDPLKEQGVIVRHKGHS